MGLKGR